MHIGIVTFGTIVAAHPAVSTAAASAATWAWTIRAWLALHGLHC